MMRISILTTLTLFFGFALSTYAEPVQLTGFDVGGTSCVSTAGAFTVTTTSTDGATPTVYRFTRTGDLDGGTADDTLSFDFVYTIYTGSSISGTDVTLGAPRPLASGSFDVHFMQDYVGDTNTGALAAGESFTVVIQNIVYTDGEGDGEVATFSGFDAVSKFGTGDAAVLIGTADASSVPVDAATGSVIPLGGVPDLTLTTSITSGATVQRLRDLDFSFEVAQPVVDTGDLILHYRFDGDLQDSSSSVNHGTTNLGLLSSADEDVAYGSGALSLRGQTDSDVDLATPIVFTASDPWSAAFWSKRAALDDNRGMVMGDTSNRVDYIWLNEVTAPTGLTFKSTSSKTYNFEVTHDLDYHHYALVADGAGNLTLYRDGSFHQTVSVAGGDTSFKITSIGNGFDTNSRSVNGQLDEVRIYDSALTAGEVGSIYSIETSEPVTPPGLSRVFFMAGQSNMLGYGYSAELAAPYKDPLPEVRYWNGANWVDLRTGFGRGTDFGPEIYFGHILNEALPTDTIYLVKFAVGGTSLWNHWKPNTGVWHTEFVSRATGALARLEADGVDYEVSAMLWMQGESDAADNKGAFYEANLRGFISDIRTRFGISDLPFYLGRIRDYYGSTVQNNLVRVAQVDVADTTHNVEWFDTDGFGDLIEGGHYDTNGQAQMGTTFADIYLASGPSRTFSGWAIGQGLDGTAGLESGFNDDPDADGVENGLEWILGGASTLADNHATQLVLNPGANETYTISFTREEDSIGRVNLDFQWSTDLTTWSPPVAIKEYESGNYTKSDGIVIEVEAGSDPDVINVQVPDSLSANGGLFFRLNASE